VQLSHMKASVSETPLRQHVTMRLPVELVSHLGAVAASKRISRTLCTELILGLGLRTLADLEARVSLPLGFPNTFLQPVTLTAAPLEPLKIPTEVKA